MKLKRMFNVVCMALISTAIYAKPALDLTGNWKVIDDKSGFTLVKVKISSNAHNQYNGHIIEAFNAPNLPPQDLSALQGFHLLFDLKQDLNDPYKLLSGQVFDPAIQQRYNVNGKVSRNGNTMILRSPSDAEKASRKLSWVRIRTAN
ncbi:DUF2147 domain-containing protein [Acinetobacter chinensis]|jgi:hypothetical protein|uniref:DUF2147 domain-containing protein n=1 Tax=Acinetobacter chinensis TaxID=2004650 RepID=UPI002934905A|nr:DUF2147 domain-containing protein [Acinetobacter chinensis]WOE42601.1 DUF2147 domain-containing protein [Acinetobacter chinensis]